MNNNMRRFSRSVFASRRSFRRNAEASKRLPSLDHHSRSASEDEKDLTDEGGEDEDSVGESQESVMPLMNLAAQKPKSPLVDKLTKAGSFVYW